MSSAEMKPISERANKKDLAHWFCETEANGPESKMRLDIRDQPLFFGQGLIQIP